MLIATLIIGTPAATARLARGPSGSGSGSGSGGNGLGGTTTTSGAPAGTPTPTTTTTATPSTPVTSNAPSEAPTAQVVSLAASQQVSGDGITLTLASYGEVHQAVTISGEAPPSDAGATIEIEGTSGPAGAALSELASATVSATGSFSAAWLPTTSAAYTLQATLGPSPVEAPQDGPQSGGGGLPDADTAAAASLTETPAFTLPVFTMSRATLYGPGFWGKRTACGETLRRGTLGVASRTLRCGTQVELYFRGRALTVPVIDRGPYANNASWDLTSATAKALRMTETAKVGALAPA